jgi:hypothetical protein
MRAEQERTQEIHGMLERSLMTERQERVAALDHVRHLKQQVQVQKQKQLEALKLFSIEN